MRHDYASMIGSITRDFTSHPAVHPSLADLEKLQPIPEKAMSATDTFTDLVVQWWNRPPKEVSLEEWGADQW